jgi:hypothetical protein
MPIQPASNPVPASLATPQTSTAPKIVFAIGQIQALAEGFSLHLFKERNRRASIPGQRNR